MAPPQSEGAKPSQTVAAITLPRPPTQPPPVYRPSADPVLAQPTIFASSDVAVFLSARRGEASATVSGGSHFTKVEDPRVRLNAYL
ncbi:hypothetical protein THAOC_30473 [Thalassiosira oceanica]|uniref:Uncharacterized protein n=1 Tax=Thalassiosira oceanica TaxID=159749 RepID=K0RBD5_THAOC|nr:hypothetical protein THAOC_30473 [Thalassiosira oceanica]|eukprot:EJK50525.1 hypothetical protein THAOC_30473 [Thalassiosira oceanica]